MPLYRFLGGQSRQVETDLTIGIDSPEKMAATAKDFKAKGVRIIKIKLGKKAEDDIDRVRAIRHAVGRDLKLRIDANQGWSYSEALHALQGMAAYDIEFCEQPMRYWDDPLLPGLREASPIKIMADESVFDHHDAERLIRAGACDYVNIKLAKTGGILEATELNRVCTHYQVPCMMGGMLESRIALTAFAHFALAHDNVIFYDMDTCMLGHKVDPVRGGLRYHGYFIEVPEDPGIGADASENFLSALDQVRI
jgi:L-alanine-DL-glutamate epimerase-like enolase superfamily enzyme